MDRILRYLFLIFFSLIAKPCFSQSDSLSKGEPDSVRFYKSLERFSKKKGKFVYTIFQSLFVLDGDHGSDTTVKNPTKFKKYKGKIIRDIHIETLDPFGYDIHDTSIAPKSFFQKAGNVLHLKSTEFAIKNQLLIHRGDSLDPFLMKESERLLRRTPFVKDVIFRVKTIPGSDSIDVYIIEQDLWSIAGGIDVIGEQKDVTIEERNFLGLGHNFKNGLLYFPASGKSYFMGNYYVPSIKNTFISSTLFYNTSLDSSTNGVSVNRPFFSPLTKWAGGADLLFKNTGEVADTFNFVLPGIKYRDIDLWAGRSYALNKPEEESESVTNLIFTLRYLDRRRIGQTSIDNDLFGLYADSKLWLTGFGLSRRSYYRDYYVYRYGIPEDVPAGSLLQILIGYENGLTTNRLYTGFQSAFGNHVPHIGYFSVGLGYGTFFNQAKAEQGVVDASFGYFSDLIKIRNWKWNFRQFVKVRTVYGMERKPGEFVNINEENGIKGFKALIPSVTNKAIVQLQTQLYLPYEFIGFRFAPFFFCNLAMVGDDNSPFIMNKVYQAYGIGLLLRNEMLVFNTFQFSIGFYPYIPGSGNDLIKFNPLRTFDFTFRDFDFGRPLLVGFE